MISQSPILSTSPLVKFLVNLRTKLCSHRLEQSVVDLYWPYSSMKDWENLTLLLVEEEEEVVEEEEGVGPKDLQKDEEATLEAVMIQAWIQRQILAAIQGGGGPGQT